MRPLNPWKMENPAMKTYCYHTRNAKGEKLCGGTIHAESYDDAAERAANRNNLEVVCTGSYSYKFVAKGQTVSLYLSVLPDMNSKAGAARKLYNDQQAERRAKQEKEEAEREEKEAAFLDLVESMGGIDAARAKLESKES